MLIDGVVDNVFFVAPDRWSLYRCQHCRSAYLDPRPTPSSIGKAYGHYYTHSATAVRDSPANLRGLRLLRRMLANGYVNRQYGSTYQPESAAGWAIARWIPRLRQSLDIKFRFLPKPAKGQRLLDIGCGNGDFLSTARDAGWDVLGLEPDTAAVEVALMQDLDVRLGSIDSMGSLSSCFDAITLSHVIEHMHQPVDALAHVYRLLRPGGVLYIETPNIDSHGASEFKRNWRGLECPRHLVLFTPDSLTGLLSRVGFVEVDIKRRPAVAADTYLSSYKMTLGRSPYDAIPETLPMGMHWRRVVDRTSTKKLEFITLTATKPKAAV